MTYTCSEQSKQLIEIGIKEDTADFTITENGYLLFHISGAKRGKREYPCWSAEALLQLLPVTLYNDEGFETHKLKLSKDSDDSYTVSYSPIYHSDYADDEFSESGKLLDVLIKAYNWLLEYNYL